MEYRQHGGGCCGRNHLSDFGTAQSIEDVNNIIRTMHGTCTEVVLTDYQIERSPQLVGYLEQTGFALVYRFLNSNSDNFCNVFLRHRDGTDLTDIPFEYGELVTNYRIPAPAPLPPVPNPTPAPPPPPEMYVGSMTPVYRCVFRDNRRGAATYWTLEALRQANPRVRRYQLGDVSVHRNGFATLNWGLIQNV